MPRRLLTPSRWVVHASMLLGFCIIFYLTTLFLDYFTLRAITRSLELWIACMVIIIFFQVAFSAFVTTPMNAEDRLSAGIWVTWVGNLGVSALVVYYSVRRPGQVLTTAWFPFFVCLQIWGGTMCVITQKTKRNLVSLGVAAGLAGVLSIVLLGAA